MLRKTSSGKFVLINRQCISENPFIQLTFLRRKTDNTSTRSSMIANNKDNKRSEVTDWYLLSESGGKNQ